MPVRRSQNWLPSIFNDFFDNELMAKANATAPAINVIETDKAYKLELAAPGMTKEDFSVRIDEENKFLYSKDGNYRCMNTGLLTNYGQEIVAVFAKNEVKGKQPWFFNGFVKPPRLNVTHYRRGFPNIKK